MVSLTVLASGSRGNCSVLASSRTRILVDAGVSCREIGRRMNLTGDHALNLSAVIISHEHSDHVAGLYVLARKLKIPVFMTGATYQAWQRWARQKNDGIRPELARLETFESGRKFHHRRHHGRCPSPSRMMRPIRWASPSAPRA